MPTKKPSRDGFFISWCIQAGDFHSESVLHENLKTGFRREGTAAPRVGCRRQTVSRGAMAWQARPVLSHPRKRVSPPSIEVPAFFRPTQGKPMESACLRLSKCSPLFWRMWKMVSTVAGRLLHQSWICCVQRGFSRPWKKRRTSPGVHSDNWRKAWYRRASTGNVEIKELLSAHHSANGGARRFFHSRCFLCFFSLGTKKRTFNGDTHRFPEILSIL